MFTKAFSLFALAAAIANAYTTPTKGPDGNSIIKPGLNEAVPVGTPYTITWTPTTPQDGTVTLLLLRGPSENIQPLYPIVEKIKNTGSYSWTPKADLEPDVTHYGIQLIVDADGQYQWSTQFGISNPNYSGGSSSASPSASASASASASGSASSSGNSTTASMTMSESASETSKVHVASTGMPVHNSSIVAPTKSLTVPVSLKTEASATAADTATASAAISTGAAAAFKAGGSLLMAGLGLAAALV